MYSRIQYLKSIHPFRSSFVYNNLMYGLVTAISEKLGNKTWEELIQTNIYTPLGMTASTFMTTVNRQNSDVAQGYVDDFDSGGVFPVPGDFNRYMVNQIYCLQKRHWIISLSLSHAGIVWDLLPRLVLDSFVPVMQTFE